MTMVNSGLKGLSQHKSELEMSNKFDLNDLYLSNFHPLDVVGRDSETRLHVGENCN